VSVPLPVRGDGQACVPARLYSLAQLYGEQCHPGRVSFVDAPTKQSLFLLTHADVFGFRYDPVDGASGGAKVDKAAELDVEQAAGIRRGEETNCKSPRGYSGSGSIDIKDEPGF
jgi:hypothetical protein